MCVCVCVGGGGGGDNRDRGLFERRRHISFTKMMVSIFYEELEHKAEKLKYKKLEVMID